MYQRFSEDAGFLFVYIHEAHPEGGWQLDVNKKDDVVFEKADTWSQRQAVARKCCKRLKLSLPTVVDELDNRVDELYAGWPERMFVIDRDGRIAYTGAQGPWGFKPDEAERALKKLLD